MKKNLNCRNSPDKVIWSLTVMYLQSSPDDTLTGWIIIESFSTARKSNFLSISTTPATLTKNEMSGSNLILLRGRTGEEIFEFFMFHRHLLQIRPNASDDSKSYWGNALGNVARLLWQRKKFPTLRPPTRSQPNEHLRPKCCLSIFWIFNFTNGFIVSSVA